MRKLIEFIVMFSPVYLVAGGWLPIWTIAVSFVLLAIFIWRGSNAPNI